ncbi:MAG: hypothetical protein KBD16_03005 [Candidatus Pacebacteria bacterium]|nr:hypothetical protein [Candidatus Paceibacterota bacterium]
MSNKLILGIIVLIIVIVGLVFAAKKTEAPIIPGDVACTEEAKICPDGSSVGRTGPNCEFAPCPGEAPTY